MTIPSLGLTLLDPAWLWLLLLLPVGGFLRRRAQPSSVDFALAIPLRRALSAEPTANSWRIRSRWIPALLRLFAMTAAVLALTSPGRIVPLSRTTEGIDLVLVMDLSSSMLAQDLDAARTRLDVAKDAAREFVARRSSDRIGLVTYARYPDLRCPLTLDHAALQTMIRELSPVASDGPEDATGIGAALAMAVRALRAAESTSRVVVLLSDGAENVAQADAPREITPDRAAALAREWEVRVMTIVVGKGTLDAERNLVPLDTTALRKAAETTQGRFYEATDAEALREIYAHIDGLEKSPLTEARFRVEAWTFGFVLAALLAFGGAQLLAATVWRTWP